MLTPRDALIVRCLTVLAIWGTSQAVITQAERYFACHDTVDGVLLLQHIKAKPDDDERTRKIIDQHNRILTLECGR